MTKGVNFWESEPILNRLAWWLEGYRGLVVSICRPASFKTWLPSLMQENVCSFSTPSIFPIIDILTWLVFEPVLHCCDWIYLWYQLKETRLPSACRVRSFRPCQAAPLRGDCGQDKVSHLMVVREGREGEEPRSPNILHRHALLMIYFLQLASTPPPPKFPTPSRSAISWGQAFTVYILGDYLRPNSWCSELHFTLLTIPLAKT